MASEMIADIVAEKRRLADEMEKSLGDQHSYVETLRLDADRIEAAHKREMADALDTGAFVEAAHKREALEALNCIDTRGLKRLLFELVEADIFDHGQINKTISAVDRAKAALAASPWKGGTK